MRVLFATSALPTHYFPMVPFGWACRAAGHEVAVATHGPLVDVVVGSGLPAVPVGGEIDFISLHEGMLREAREDGGTYDPKRLFLQIAEAMAGDLVRFAREWRPDIVVWDPATFAAPVAAAAVGAPAMRYLWGPDILGRPAARDELRPRLSSLFDTFGLSLPEDPQWWTADPCPTSLQPPAGPDRLGVRYLPYSQHRQVPMAMLDEPARARVCVTLGTNLDRLLGGDFPVARVVDSLAGLDLEIVLMIAPGQREFVHEVSPDVQVVENCPLDLLLPGCVALINHGGSGTMLTAAVHGVPQLFMPLMPDLRFNAELFSRVGAGRCLAAEEFNADGIRAGLLELLGDQSYAESARLLAKDMGQRPAPAALVATTQQLVQGAH